MRKRKEIEESLDDFLRGIAPEILFKADEDAHRRRQRTALLAAAAIEMRKAQLEVVLDIRDAVTTWIAGDLSARSTAQQYRNTAVDVFVKLLRSIDTKLDRIWKRGRP